MALSRRHLLKLAAASFVFFRIQHVFAAGLSELTPRVLPSFVDTLIPADQSPSGTDLQVDRKLLEKMASDQPYLKLLEYGCVWLEQAANRKFEKSFWQLSDQQRQQIVSRLADQPASTHAHRFFQRILNDSFEVYYSDPRSWSGLAINRPPQPEGYADYHRSPTLS